MKRIIKLAVMFGCAVIPMATLSAKVTVLEAPPPSSPVLIDFGNSQSYRGASTPSPDSLGHYWNSVSDGGLNSPLTNAAGGATTMGLSFRAAAGTDSYNGPAGVNQNPGSCVIDANALGDLG